MIVRLLYSLLVVFCASSCSVGSYSHYPKAKKQKVKTATKKRVSGFEKIDFNQVSISIQKRNVFTFSTHEIARVAIENNIAEKELMGLKTSEKESPPGDGKPRDVTQTNKKAKRAFISSIIALGSLAAGLTVSPIFLLVMLPFAVLAFIYSIIALKQIKRTGEYGRTKAEFALYSSIPIIVLSIVGLLAYLMSNGTGFQVGGFVFY